MAMFIHLFSLGSSLFQEEIELACEQQTYFRSSLVVPGRPEIRLLFAD